METISKKSIKRESVTLSEMYNRYGRVTKKMQEELQKSGYSLTDLGTSKKCYTRSGEIKRHYKANEGEIYFGIGFYNIQIGRNNVYRAFVKRIKS